MPKKPDLSKAFGERFKTEEKVEVQDPLAAAADSIKKEASVQESIQEDRQASSDPFMPEREQESMQDEKNVRMHAYTPDVIHESMDVSKQGRKKASKHTGSQISPQESPSISSQASRGKGVEIEMLYDQIQQKKHLSNGSFRYRADELEKLDAIFKGLEEKKPGRISKNDIARMALIAFYEDYENNGDESILAQVFKRM